MAGVLWASAISQLVDTDRAAVEVCDQVRERLAGEDPDLVLLFASAQHLAAMPRIVERLRRAFPRARRLGCSSRSVIGDGREIEDGPGIALSGAWLPGVEIEALEAPQGALRPFRAPPESDLLLLADPFASGLEPLLAELDARFPGRTKIGGIASGGRQPRANLLLLDDRELRGGVVGLALHGRIRVDSVVAQGCRPVGSPLFVTRAEGNVVHELDGRPPLETLNRLFDEAQDERERALFQTSLFLGVAMRPSESEYGRGDYLIRNLIGVDPESGALHVAARIEMPQIVQFHLRDAHTADADLSERLAAYARREGPPRGVLLVSCLGRGRGLYGMPDHDCESLREQLGEVPVVGFFGNGEIGPVGDRSFLHGYTSALALFQAPPAS